MYLYFIKSGPLPSAPIKIGIAANVEARIGELQTGNPTELIIMYKVPMKSRKHAYDVETQLHKDFKRQNIRGEWFTSQIIHKIKIKELLNDSEKLYKNNDIEMVCEANKYI